MAQTRPDIPGYRILRRLGHGGMSEIWLAEQVALARPVAVKIVSPGDEADSRLARFRQEAAIIARFDHPNVVGIIEFGETGDGRLFFSMPYVPNGTLAEAGLQGDTPRVREVLAQVLDALAYIHEHGVVHRDIKPENVLFDHVGRARLADFGVSRSIEALSRHTRSGETFGSSLYMSPEQARGELPDGRSDLYSLGALTYEILTGVAPFQGPDHLSVVVAHLQSPVPRMPEHLRHWQGWIDTAMAKKREQRFADAGAMRAALARLPGQARRERWLPRPPRLPQLALLPATLPRIALPMLAAVLVILALWRLGLSGPQPAGPVPAPSADQAVPLAPSTAQGGQAAPAATASPGPGAEPGETDLAARLDDPEPVARTGSEPGSDAAPAPAPDTATPADPASAPLPVPPVTAVPEPAAAVRVAPPPARSVAPAAAADPPEPQVVVGTFEVVPRVPLLLLAGNREQRLERIDRYLDAGRQQIEADRANVERLRRQAPNREENRRLREAYDQRKANYETWRRQLLALRSRAEGS